MRGHVRIPRSVVSAPCGCGRETPARSLAKALSYRAVSLLVMTLVAWAVTRRLGVAAAIGAGDALLKVGLFYAHERFWARVRLGRASPPDYQI